MLTALLLAGSLVPLAGMLLALLAAARLRRRAQAARPESRGAFGPAGARVPAPRRR